MADPGDLIGHTLFEPLTNSEKEKNWDKIVTLSRNKIVTLSQVRRHKMGLIRAQQLADKNLPCHAVKTVYRGQHEATAIT